MPKNNGRNRRAWRKARADERAREAMCEGLPKPDTDQEG